MRMKPSNDDIQNYLAVVLDEGGTNEYDELVFTVDSLVRAVQDGKLILPSLKVRNQWLKEVE